MALKECELWSTFCNVHPTDIERNYLMLDCGFVVGNIEALEMIIGELHKIIQSLMEFM